MDGYGGDGGSPTEAEINGAYKLTVDTRGNLYIADTWNHRIRKVEGVFVPPDSVITGKVTDASTRLPLSDVDITIISHFPYIARTDQNRSYTISGLPPGNFVATFLKSGYLWQTINGTLATGKTQLLDIEMSLSQVPPLSVIVT